MTLWGIDLWAAMLIFARLGAMMMLLPGFSEPAVPARIRLGLALALTLCLAGAIAPRIPSMPEDTLGAAGMVVGEVLIGVMIGAGARFLMSALATAGQIMGLESGLSFAQTADPTANASGQIFAVFLGLMGATLIFSSGLHRVFIAGMAGSYEVFTPGAATPVGDAAALAVDMTSKSFRTGFQIAAPVVVAGLVFRVGLGALARLVPSIQVFFVALPLQLLGAFAVIALGLSTGMLMWLSSLNEYARALN
ncbi:MAG: flagellar biosynthetic protein FliR [Hyphomonadaceae bacterium]